MTSLRRALLASLALASGGLVGCSSSTATPTPTIVTDAGVAADASLAGEEDASSTTCVDGRAQAYPSPPYALTPGQTLPDLRIGELALHTFFTPCAPRAGLLVLRVVAPWCGTCLWHAAHAGEVLADSALEGRVRLLDVVIGDVDNGPPRGADADGWSVRTGAAAVADPAHVLGPLFPAFDALPLYVLVDTRTMKVEGTLANPDTTDLASRVHRLLAQLDGVPAPELPRAPPRFDGRFTRQERDLLADMTLPGAPPPDLTNAHGDDPMAAELGRRLFSDAALTPTGEVSCATCHVPKRAFADALPQSIGLSRIDRNAPSLTLAAHARWQFWDGRADTLWMQALAPLEDRREMGSSRLFVAHAVHQRYAAEYESVFGPLPPLAEAPRSGRPGEPAYDALPPASRLAVTRVFVNVGKALAAFERTLRPRASRFDAYVGGDSSALTDPEKDGLVEFFRGGCAQCHWGPRLTDDAFHNLRFPTGRVDGLPDRGRADAIATLLGSDLNALGPFSDAPVAGERLRVLTSSPRMIGAFRTPTLRGVASTGPYGHGGVHATLEAVADHYGRRGLPPADGHAAGVTEPWVPSFTPAHGRMMVPFLRVLTESQAE